MESKDLINNFKIVKECIYKNEYYSVRDNGAIFRHARKDMRIRKHDNIWTFGSPNNYGYLIISNEVVHRIVAFAFIGEPPTPQHVVDHIDTNRQNNRPENLRWLTKLENILKNPITVNKIIYLCGSIEAFLNDPSILKQHVKENSNFEWMRAVTPKEAQISWKRMHKWANWKNTKTSSSGETIGEWIFKDNKSTLLTKKEPDVVKSLTPNAVQKKLKTPTEFLCCPQEITDNPIASYTANLKVEKLFSKNKLTELSIVNFAQSKDGNTLWIMSKLSGGTSIKPWFLVQVTYEDNLFVHTSLGSFFEKIGAEREFTIAQGLDWNGRNSIDYYAG